MDAWRKMGDLDPTMARPLYEEVKPWKGLPGVSASPKPWSSVELPDLFLTNLIHDVDHTFTDDSLTDFSGSGAQSGSDRENSPNGFQDFFLRKESPDCIETSSPPVFAPAPSTNMFQLPSMDMVPSMSLFQADPMGAVANPLSQPSFCVPASDVSPPLQNLSQTPAPRPGMIPSMDSTGSNTASTSSASSPLSASVPEESLLAPIHMLPGSNVDARSALAQLRSTGTLEPVCARPKLNRANSSTSASVPRRTDPPPKTASADEASSWSKKTAHNAIERRYRSNINDRIAGLRDVVPALREMRPRDGRRKRRRGKAEAEELVDGVAAATKLSKAAVLTKATEYICYLKSREVQLSREVAGLRMLVRSLEGGEELLSQFAAEMEKIHAAYPPIDTVYGDASPRSMPEESEELAGDSDDGDDADDSASSGSVETERASKSARYMFGAFAGLSFLGRSSDWSRAQDTNSSPPVRVLQASHQLVKRATPYLPESHPYDHVPLAALIIEVLQGAVLVLGGLALLLVLYYRTSAWLRRRSVQSARKLQSAQPITTILPSPLEHAASSPLLPRDKAVCAYESLCTFSPVPRSLFGVGLRLVWDGFLLLLVHVPGIPYLWKRVVDPTAALLSKRALMRRGEMELSLGHTLHCTPWRYWHTVLVLERYRVLYGATVDEQLLLALLHYNAARRAYVPGAQSVALRLWRAAGVAMVDEPQVSDEERQRLASILSLPLPLAWAHVRDASGADDLVSVSPLSNLMEALRSEALMSYWTTVLASMMRASDSSHAQGCLAPVVLDVVSDTASLSQLQKDLSSMTQCPPRTATAVEQLGVAHGVLALARGHVQHARQLARSLAALPCRTRSACEFVSLLHDTEESRSPSPSGPVDMLACVAIGWMRLQRANALADAAQRRLMLAASRAALQTLASQCLWTFVSPDTPKGGDDVAPLPRSLCLGISLEHALDTLMDNLSIMSMPV